MAMAAEAAPFADTIRASRPDDEMPLDETINLDEADTSLRTTLSSLRNGNENDQEFSLIYGAIEAQWILTVLDDTSNKLNLASYLTPDILEDAAIMKSMDSRFAITLRDHFKIEQDYKEFLESEEYERRHEDPLVMKAFQTLDLCLADSTRTIARLLKNNPAVVLRLRELCPKRDPAVLEFINTFARLRKLVHNKLKMTAEEEKSMKQQLAHLIEREREDSSRSTELRERLEKERTEHTQVITVKSAKIERLRNQISTLASETEQAWNSFQVQMKNNADLKAKVYKTKEKDLNSRLDKENKAFLEESNEHWAAELSNHRTFHRESEEVQKTIEIYDEKMMEKYKEIEDLQRVYDKESMQLHRLEHYFQEVDTENRRVEEEQKRLQELRDNELKIERRRHQAAVLVQKLFKGFQTQNLDRPPKKKEKKKKK